MGSSSTGGLSPIPKQRNRKQPAWMQPVLSGALNIASASGMRKRIPQLSSRPLEPHPCWPPCPFVPLLHLADCCCTAHCTPCPDLCCRHRLCQQGSVQHVWLQVHVCPYLDPHTIHPRWHASVPYGRHLSVQEAAAAAAATPGSCVRRIHRVVQPQFEREHCRIIPSHEGKYAESAVAVLYQGYPFTVLYHLAPGAEGGILFPHL
jgi:hypothetical protein